MQSKVKTIGMTLEAFGILGVAVLFAVAGLLLIANS